MEIAILIPVGLLVGYLLTIHAGIIAAIIGFIAGFYMIGRIEGLEALMYVPSLLAYVVGAIVGIAVLCAVGKFSFIALLTTIFIP